MPCHMSVSKQPSQIISQKPFPEATHRPYFPTQAGTSSDTKKSTHCPCINPFKHQTNTGQEFSARKVSIYSTKNQCLIRAELRPHSLNPHTTPTWNKDYVFATVLSEKNNSSSLELLVCWTCWAQELLNQLEKIHAPLPWVLQGPLYGFEHHTD